MKRVDILKKEFKFSNDEIDGIFKFLSEKKISIAKLEDIPEKLIDANMNNKQKVALMFASGIYMASKMNNIEDEAENRSARISDRDITIDDIKKIFGISDQDIRTLYTMLGKDHSDNQIEFLISMANNLDIGIRLKLCTSYLVGYFSVRY